MHFFVGYLRKGKCFILKEILKMVIDSFYQVMASWVEVLDGII